MNLPEQSADQNLQSAWKELSRGLLTGLPIAVGYIPVAIAFAVISQTRGVPAFFIILLSLLVFAGASQFAAVGMWSAGSAWGEIVLATLVLNLRHLLFSASLSHRLEKNITPGWAALLSFGVTDETFATASLQPEKTLSRYYILGLNFLAYTAWVGGTGLGVLLASQLPQIVKNSLGIALYALFIGLLVPAVRESRPALLVLFMALIASSALFWFPGFEAVPPGWKVIITTVLAAGGGAWLFQEAEI
ncbi:MAG TPA: AzlC family ABC transporter permease [Syntrophomonadaceae bacterium]|nr:AzlC family ABC transporter permease [Syntrophomonadaceae bacterium]